MNNDIHSDGKNFNICANVYQGEEGNLQNSASAGGAAGQERKQIYTHEAQWPLYAINFSNRQEKNFRLALGSYSEDLQNQVEIIKLDEDKGDFEHCSYFEHEYPPTKIMWIPDQVSFCQTFTIIFIQRGSHPDLIATSGEYLRIWQVGDDSKNVTLKSKLTNVTKIISQN